MSLIWYLLTGAAMGTLSGLLGVGGGLVAVPIMVYCLGMDTKLAMGTSLAVIIPVAMSGTVKQYLQDHVDIKVALCIAVSGIVFAYLGAYLNDKLPELWLRRGFGVFMILVALKMLLSK